MGALIDLSGQRFGRLLVLGRDSTKNKKEAYWNCQCDCGNTKSIRSSALRGGQTKSCGCYNNENRVNIGKNNANNLIGQKFERLTVIGDSGERTIHRNIIWECECECGSKIKVPGSNLLSGNTKSCGCLLSYGESFISNLLRKHNIEYKTEVSFKDLKDIKELRFDFGIYKNGELVQLIEYDGKQHYDQSAPYYSMNMIKHDKMKNVYCKENKIPLLRCRKEDLTEELIGRIIK